MKSKLRNRAIIAVNRWLGNNECGQQKIKMPKMPKMI
jgi:hypothetical protein